MNADVYDSLMCRHHNGRIWLVGGTQESATLARMIAQEQWPCTVSVTTEAATALYPSAPLLRVRVGKLDAIELAQFLQAESISVILDASHPYAVEVSKLAIAAACQYQIPYLRYERPRLDLISRADHPNFSDQGRENSQTYICLDSFDTLLRSEILTGQRVLLTVGYRTLLLFQPWQDKCTLFARILPSVPALEAALAAGFTPDRLIALRPPISLDLERSLWQQWQISLVVTKASGVAGGEDVKRIVASELGVPVVVIDRPAIEYPQQTSDVATAVQFCRQHLTPSKL
ncbi:cobalt-precorrin-6A reductase [Microcoleus sp. FACHB-68]|uniref:cobalt-precorrin-6A reductase n=1 Tax=Microcoleus sp. FACHB-68 TaxID=2692826 RepID=UPI001F54C89F|nr:cobalt-precorrin-6A reductase [Microcoleus sp. FACHB-68]